MPEMRQESGSEPLVRTLATGYSSGTVLELHSHSWVQLIYASEGVMSVKTSEGTWVVPSHRGVWIPANTPHSVAMSGWVSMRTLYIVPELVSAFATRCCVVAIPALLRELILHATAQGPLRRDVPEHRHLVDFLLDQLRVLPVVPLDLPMPRDWRALRLAVRLQEDPGETAPIQTLARGTGASRRTLERLFQKETGMSLGRWRQQARLLQAMRLLARGEPVTSIALEGRLPELERIHRRVRERARHHSGTLLFGTRAARRSPSLTDEPRVGWRGGVRRAGIDQGHRTETRT
jgi:AraC-like DNA-binding protein